MAVIIAFPSTFGPEKVDVSVETACEFELLAKALTDLQANLDFLRDHLVDMQKSHQRAVCEVECTAF